MAFFDNIMNLFGGAPSGGGDAINPAIIDPVAQQTIAAPGTIERLASGNFPSNKPTGGGGGFFGSMDAEDRKMMLLRLAAGMADKSKGRSTASALASSLAPAMIETKAAKGKRADQRRKDRATELEEKKFGLAERELEKKYGQPKVGTFGQKVADYQRTYGGTAQEAAERIRKEQLTDIGMGGLMKTVADPYSGLGTDEIQSGAGNINKIIEAMIPGGSRGPAIPTYGGGNPPQLSGGQVDDVVRQMKARGATDDQIAAEFKRRNIQGF